LGNSTAVKTYLDKVFSQYRTGRATEHTYRGDLANLIEEIIPGVKATNEPKRQECGAPDYILTNKNNLPVGYIEAKDIGIDLKSTEKSEQLKRYRDSLENLILTDYLEFRFYRGGEKVHTISIGEIDDGKLKPIKDSWEKLEDYLREFCTFHIQSITSPEKLAKMMAGKAKLMKDIIFKALNHEDETTLKDQLEAFKKILIHDMDESTFADIYAQTIAYGLFAARLNDETPEDFSRQEALNLVPKSNPFLKKLFGYIAGFELDDRLVWIVDALAEVFGACDLNKILKNFGKSTQMHDPMIHFYETFLKEYDKKLRKSKGVYYTPEPVVNFIVRAVDDILKSEFNLPKGLADTSKVKIERDIQKHDGRYKNGIAKETVNVHKVQILDPATGTGTFLAAVIKHIYENNFVNQQGMWSGYVENHLIPRIHGFEILMASYTMCHLKIDMLLKETGYKSKNNDRLQVYLTNSLEEADPYTGTIFSSWLSQEASEANFIKREAPVMVILGNPPYSGESANKGEWIIELLEDYKVEPGGGKLKEKNSKWLNDDYVKFLRYGQHFIEKNKSGVLAFINPHGFLDNPTFRGMRWNLLKTYDKIFTINLHGNSKKKEVCPDGSKDENVFDIMQGVSINVFVKTGAKKVKELGSVFHFDLFGKRAEKYDFLLKNNLATVPFTILENREPQYFFIKKDYELKEEYDLGIDLKALFKTNVMGFQTHRDSLCIDITKKDLVNKLNYFISPENSIENIAEKYSIKPSSIDNKKREALSNIELSKDIISCVYRPFDNRFIHFNRILVDRPRKELLISVKNKDNLILGVGKSGIAVGDMTWCLAFISEVPVDANVFRRGGINLFPAYIYSEENIMSVGGCNREANMNEAIIERLSDKLDLVFKIDSSVERLSFSPKDIIYYIYAILHSPKYRDKYSDFLKYDFPKIPYPEDVTTFWKLVEKGGELRQIHLMESSTLENHDFYFPVDGSNEVEKPVFKENKVFINKDQYFDNVPEVAWNFYIGGYQPAQKWLKDRKGRVLEYDDISHYQKIIKALVETDRIMKEMDDVF